MVLLYDTYVDILGICNIQEHSSHISVRQSYTGRCTGRYHHNRPTGFLACCIHILRTHNITYNIMQAEIFSLNHWSETAINVFTAEQFL